MPFDGVNYTSAPITPPYAYHPSAPAIADVLSNGLIQAYALARQGGRLIGQQTYRHWLQFYRAYEENGTNGFGDDEDGNAVFIEIAQFRKYVSPHWTHAVFEAHFRLFGSQPIRAYHQIRATDGSDDVFGDAVETVYEIVHGRDRVHGEDPYAPDAPGLYSVQGIMALEDLNESAGMLDFIVEAHATVDGDSAIAELYRPEFITAWLECIG